MVGGVLEHEPVFFRVRHQHRIRSTSSPAPSLDRRLADVVAVYNVKNMQYHTRRAGYNEWVWDSRGPVDCIHSLSRISL